MKTTNETKRIGRIRVTTEFIKDVYTLMPSVFVHILSSIKDINIISIQNEIVEMFATSPHFEEVEDMLLSPYYTLHITKDTPTGKAEDVVYHFEWKKKSENE